MRHLILTAAALILAACAAPVETRQYLLATPEASTALGPTPAIGLRELAMPLYARRQEIALLGPDGAIVSSPDHIWADDLARASTRLIARRLGAGGEVYAEPWPLGADPQLLVAVEVDRFVGALGGETVLEGEITVSRIDDRGRPLRRSFAIRTTAAGPGHGDLVRAYSEALAMLAEDIAEAAAGA
ncbi:MAG: PqiC family protein [Pseudomonadota bacterium]